LPESLIRIPTSRLELNILYIIHSSLHITSYVAKRVKWLLLLLLSWLLNGQVTQTLGKHIMLQISCSVSLPKVVKIGFGYVPYLE